MKKIFLLIALVVSLGLFAAPKAQAGVSFGISIGGGYPYGYAPYGYGYYPPYYGGYAVYPGYYYAGPRYYGSYYGPRYRVYYGGYRGGRYYTSGRRVVVHSSRRR